MEDRPNYILVTAGAPQALAERVNEKRLKGYQPQGGVTSGPPPENWAQAMVRTESSKRLWPLPPI